jgi:hypothetical protein
VSCQVSELLIGNGQRVLVSYTAENRTHAMTHTHTHTHTHTQESMQDGVSQPSTAIGVAVATVAMFLQ